MRDTAIACHNGYGLPELYSNNNGNNKENSSIENKYLPACVYFAVLPLSSQGILQCWKRGYKWLVCEPLNYLYSSYTFSVALSSCKQNNKCGNFTLLFSRGEHGFVLIKVLAARAAHLFFRIGKIKFFTSFACFSQFYFLTQTEYFACLLYTSPSPRDLSTSRMPSSA